MTRALPTRVLHITRDFPPRVCGGLSVAVGDVARAQARAGGVVAVISFDGYRPRARPGAFGPARAERQGPISILRVSAPDQLASAREFGASAAPEIAHVHDPWLAPFAAELRARLGPPLVYTRHVAHRVQDCLRGLAEPTQSARAETDAFAAADLIHAPSRAAAADLSPREAARTAIQPLGIDPPAPDAASLPRAHRDAIVYAGRFSDIRGTGELVSAIPLIAGRAPTCRIVVAGGCPESARAEARWRHRFDRELSAEARARVELAGWLDRRRLAALYDRAAVVAIPSRFETFGLTAVEAVMRGAPVAASRGGGLAEILADFSPDAVGFFEPGDARGLADTASALWRDADRASRLARRGARLARSRFSARRAAEALYALYADALRS